MPERGQVNAVAWVPQGSELVADAAVGATVLYVANALDFDDDGGTLSLNGSLYEYAASEEDTDTITLDAALPVAALTGDRVLVYGGGQVVTDYIAFVSLGDGDEIEVPIPFAQRDLWPEGEYDDPVMVDLTPDLLTIEAVPGRTPIRDGSFINPGTLPPPAPAPAPTVSPTPKVYGTTDSLVVVVDQSLVRAGTVIDYYVSTVDGFDTATTPSVASDYSTVVVLTHTNDGNPFQLGTTYFVRVVCRNDAGAAPPSGQASGQLDPTVTSQLIASQLVAGFILAGQIQVGTITIDPTGGIVIPQPDGGVIRLPANGIDYAQITAHLVAKSLNVQDNLQVSGSGQVNGTIELRSGISRPTDAPTPAYEWPKITTVLGDGSTDQAFTYNGMAPDIGTAAGPEGVNRSVVAVAFYGGALRFIDNRTGALMAYPDPTSGKAWTTNFDIFGGVASDPTRGLYWVLGKDRNRNSDWYVYAIDSTTFDKRGEWYWWNDSNVAGYYPRIAYWAGTLYESWVHGDKQLRVRRMPVGGTNAAPTLSNIAGTSPTDLLLGVQSARYAMGAFEVGTFDDPGGTQVYLVYGIADGGNLYVRKIDGTTTSVLASFLRPTSKIRGLRWTAGGTLGSRFIAYDSTGQLWFFSEVMLDTTIRATESWFDPQTATTTWDASYPNATGTHETEEGNVYAELVWKARAWLSVTNDPAPDEANLDPTNLDKANASRVYIGAGSGTRYLHATLGKSIRTVATTVDDDYPDRLRSYRNGLALNWWTPEDVGATVTGTYIAAGTTIKDIAVGSAGQEAILSQPLTAPPGTPTTINVTVTRSQFGRKLWTISKLLTSGKTPESANGFTGIASPGRIKSTAADTNPLLDLKGDGSWRLAPLSGDGLGGFTNDSPVQEFNHTSQGSGATGWVRMTGGAFTIARPGVYLVYQEEVFGTGTAGTNGRRGIGFNSGKSGVIGTAPDSDTVHLANNPTNNGTYMSICVPKVYEGGEIITPWRYTDVSGHYSAGIGFLRAFKIG